MECPRHCNKKKTAKKRTNDKKKGAEICDYCSNFCNENGCSCECMVHAQADAVRKHTKAPNARQTLRTHNACYLDTHARTARKKCQHCTVGGSLQKVAELSRSPWQQVVFEPVSPYASSVPKAFRNVSSIIRHSASRQEHPNVSDRVALNRHVS